MFLGVANSPAFLAKPVIRVAFLSYAGKKTRHSDVKEVFGIQLQCSKVRGPRAVCRALMVAASVTQAYIYRLRGGGLPHRNGFYQCFYPSVKYSKRFGIINFFFKKRELFKNQKIMM